MSLEHKEICWLECDGCSATLGDEDFDTYGDEKDLLADAEEDGWRPSGNEWYCQDCALKKALVELTPIQQAALMHGKQPFIPYAHGGFKR